MSIDTIIKVSGTIPANTTTNSIANIDVPEDGQIVCIGALLLGHPALVGAQAHANFVASAELSFLSTNQIGVNDGRGTIGGIGLSVVQSWSEAAETGGAGFKASEMVDICLEDGITVQAGERIHLHGYSNNAILTATATFLMYLRTSGGARRARKRR